MLSEIAKSYKTLVHLLPELIEASGYRNDFLSKKMGITPATFSAKKLRGNWSVDEVVSLIALIENEDVEERLMLELLRGQKDEEYVSATDFRKEIAKWK